ncbi:zinc finger protein ZFP2-like [Ornithodoros turicata]|uniref:zinc finger protein ZFP2-like n=1 Tax=Ornithodoros turicata TaxID=34597 RepID=UPI00313891F9
MQLSPELSGELVRVKLEPPDAACLPEQGQQQHCSKTESGGGTCGVTGGMCDIKEEPREESSNKHPIIEVKTEPYNVAILAEQDQMEHSCHSTAEVSGAKRSPGMFHLKGQPRETSAQEPSGNSSSNVQLEMSTDAEPRIDDTDAVTVNCRHTDFKHRELSPDQSDAHQGADRSSISNNEKDRLYECVDVGHPKTHREKTFTCNTCSATFGLVSALGVHTKQHLGEGLYKCRLCMSQASRRNDTLVHAFDKSESHPTASGDQMGGNRLGCELCPSTFPESKSAKNHTLKGAGKKPWKCSLCPAEFNHRTQLRCHRLTHVGEKPYKCDICSATFVSRGHLKNHMQTHADGKPRQCRFCHAEFVHLCSLRDHERAHAGEKPYKCDACPAEFSHNTNLRRHKRMHTGGRPHKCDLCSAAFSQVQNLRDHVRTHTGEKPYKCDLCDAAFSRSTHLGRHKRTHTGERPYRCNVCSAQFRQGSQLWCHRRTHTGEKPHKCDLCPAEFSQSAGLLRHKGTHTGEKPYKCDLCPAEFTQMHHLKGHVRIHTGEKPYGCDLCDARFRLSSQLRCHKQKHAG